MEALAGAVKKYLDFLEGQQKRTSETHASNELIRSLEDNWSLHIIEGKKHEPISEKYISVHESLQPLKEYEPFCLLDIAPANRYNRRHWIDGITLPYPVSLWKYSQGNYLENLYFICVACKIMEKIIRNALVDHLVENRLLFESQFGSVPGRSCALQLLVCMERWIKVLDDRGQVNVIYTDYSKAFDTVSHQKLLKNLYGLGLEKIHGNGLRRRHTLEEEFYSPEDGISLVNRSRTSGLLSSKLYIVIIKQVSKHLSRLHASEPWSPCYFCLPLLSSR